MVIIIRIRTKMVEPQGDNHDGGSVFILGNLQDRKQQKKDLN